MPLKDERRRAQILRGVSAENNAAVLMICDGAQELACVAVDCAASAVRMLKMLRMDQDRDFSPGDAADRVYADHLMRAAVSYAIQYGAYRIESRVKGMDSFFEAKGFQKSGTGFPTMDLKDIVHIHSRK